MNEYFFFSKTSNMKKNILIAVLFAFISSGCAASTVVTMHSRAYPPKPKGCVIDIYDSRIPRRDYAELARIYNADGKIEPILEKAKKIGADAIIVISSEKQFANLYKGAGSPCSVKGLSAEAIKYK